MKTEIKNQDDIVFESRNKNYGAYYIRKKYNKNLTRAMSISVAALLLATIIPFIIFKEARSVNIERNVGAVFPGLTPPRDEPPPPPPPPPPAAVIEQRVRFTAPRVTTDSVEDTHLLNPDDYNQPLAPPPPETTDPIAVVEPVAVIQQTAPILTIVELMPSFEGGEDVMYRWLGENVVYPQIARETGIQGTVVITFVVEKDGTITGQQLLRDIGGGCGEEAMRVVKLMPKWKAGRQNGTPVRVQFNLPIRFTLS